MTLGLGIDLGGTYVRAALVDPAVGIVAVEKKAIEERSPEAVVEVIAAACAEVLKSPRAHEAKHCGVGVAGQLVGDTGNIAVAPNLGWRDVPFGSLLTQRLHRSVRVVNDLAAAAWGELHAGAARGYQDAFVVFVGSGVGSCVIAHGNLVRGAGGVAGEFGHIKMVRDGRPCGCGERGCLEAYAGGHNLLAQMREALAGGRPSLLRQLAPTEDDLTPVHLEMAALQGDGVASEIYERAASFLGLAVANQVTVLNPGVLVLGGGVLSRCPELRRRIVSDVAQWSSAVSRIDLRIAEAALGDDSGLVGAALLAL